MTDRLSLYSYWRSSAAYRVRIGLNIKALPYDIAPVHLLRDGGEQHGAEFAAANPQQLVPVLQHGHRLMRQSLAILEYLDEVWPTPPLLPATARDRQRVRALAQLVACDIHPLNNLRVMQYFERDWGVPAARARRLDAALDRCRGSMRSRRCCRIIPRPARSATAMRRPSPIAA